MKKITALILISALLLCSCTDPNDSPEYTTTTPDNSIITTVTTTSGATEASTEETPEPLEEVMVQLPDNMTFVETGYWKDFDILEDYILCDHPKSHTDFTSVLKFYDIKTGKLVSSVTMPESTEVYAVYEGEGDVLCNITLIKTIDDKGGRYFEYSSATVFNDFTCDISDKPLTELEASIKHGSYYIAGKGIDLVEARSNGYVLVEGYEEEGDLVGKKSRYPQYWFAIDDNRFVYRMAGYECVPGFGFYDFETGTDTFIPDSENHMPLGYRDGKIYSYETVWDGRPQGLYATDIETLETVLISEEPILLGRNDRIEYHMPDNGEYILIYREWYADEEYTDRHCAIYKADIKTGKILEETVLPSELEIYWCPGYIDDNRILFVSDYGEGGFIILDLK